MKPRADAHPAAPRRARAADGSGYTLTEVLAVTIIIVILVGISVPSFNAMLRSANESRANTLLRLSASAAQNAALGAGAGEDTAAAFLFEPGGRLRIVGAREAGEYTPGDGVGGDGEPRTIFVPDPTIQSFELPSNMLVRGLAPAGSIENGSDDSTDYAWYSSNRYDESQLNWVLPETGFVDPDNLDDGQQGYKRQSFMLRFEGGTGRAAVDVKRQSLLFDPRPEVGFRTGGAWSGEDFRPDLEPNHRSLVSGVLNDSQIDADDLEDLIGDSSPDTVLTRQATMVGLYDVRDMAAAVGASDERPAGFDGVDDLTGSLYSAGTGGDGLRSPMIDSELSNEVNTQMRLVADLFTLERYSGRMVRVPGATGEDN